MAWEDIKDEFVKLDALEAGDKFYTRIALGFGYFSEHRPCVFTVARIPQKYLAEIKSINLEHAVAVFREDGTMQFLDKENLVFKIDS